jgi:hypothetical protein
VTLRLEVWVAAAMGLSVTSPSLVLSIGDGTTYDTGAVRAAAVTLQLRFRTMAAGHCRDTALSRWHEQLHVAHRSLLTSLATSS